MLLMLILGRLVLAGVFGLAGVSKLLDPAGSRRALVDFGVPDKLARPLGMLLPTTELIIAFSLLPSSSAWYAAIGSLLLLGVFLIGIITSLARGRAPDCHCFGQVHSEPIGWSTVTRNLALVGVGAFVVWQGRVSPSPSILARAARLTLSGPVGSMASLVTLLLVALATWFVLRSWNQPEMWRRLAAAAAKIGIGLSFPVSSQQAEGLAVGLPLDSPAPNFRLQTLEGQVMTLASLLARGKPLLLLFTHPQCGPCLALMPQIGSWQREHEDQLDIAVISQGSAEDNRMKTEEHGFSRLLLQEEREVSEAYKVYGTPGAVLVRSDGLIGSRVALGPGPVWQLIAENIGMRSAGIVPVLLGESLAVDSPAPQFRLQDVDGMPVGLDDLLAVGKPLLLVFMNPAWPPSIGLLNDLAGWRRELDGKLQVIVLSEGKPLETIEFGSVRILLQDKREVAEAYRAFGTPAAVVVRADGHIGSSLALGVDAIQALARDTAGISTRLVHIVGTSRLASTI